jgi:DnaJ-class molecular chaperone
MAPMAGKRESYEVLGGDRSATDKRIAEAYRKVAIKTRTRATAKPW